MDFSKPTCLGVLAALLSLAPAMPAAAQNSGRVGAVNQDATGAPPGAASRTLTIGTNVIFKERVQTSAQGSTQILFPDQSTLNVGRNSSIVIDEFVYDPNAGTGKMVASLAKGAMRFVGGQISHTAGVTINSPVATLGIRGGVATVIYPAPPGLGGSGGGGGGCGGELVIGHVGSSTIRNNAGQATLQPGYATCVTGPNDPIPPPFRIPDAVLQQIMQWLTSGAHQHGGVRDLPTDAMAARLGFGTSIVGDPNHPPGSDPLGYFSIFDGGNTVVRNKSQSNQTNSVIVPPPPPPPDTYPGEGCDCGEYYHGGGSN